MEPLWGGVTKVCINSPGHMTKMATKPIYEKIFKIFSGTSGPISTKLGMYHLGQKPIIVSNDDPCVDLDVFYAKVKFGYTGLSLGKSENSGFFQKVQCIAACGLKVCTCRQLLELMEVSEY